MNRDQAHTILWALGAPSSEEQRAAAIGIVIDLLQRPRTESVTVHRNEMEGDIWVTTQGIIANEQEARRRAEHERDELLAAARKAVPVAGRAEPALNELHDLVARIDKA